MRRAKFLEVNFIEALPQSIGSAEVNNYLLWVLFTVRGNEAIAGGCCVFRLGLLKYAPHALNNALEF